MIDNFIYNYRYYIGGALILVILGGLGIIGWDKYYRAEKVKFNDQLVQLKDQNDLLRQELSNLSAKQTEIVETVSNIGKLNINTASLQELDMLPGIGPVRAADIVAYRVQNGGFKTIEELKSIKGIGDKSFDSLKDLVTVQ